MNQDELKQVLYETNFSIALLSRHLQDTVLILHELIQRVDALDNKVAKLETDMKTRSLLN